jgi:hypothetical protein
MDEPTKIAFDTETIVETLWARRIGPERYRIDNIPFFVYGVSLGDVVEARWREEDLRPHRGAPEGREQAQIDERDEDEGDEEYGFPYFVRVLEKSGNRTLRVAFSDYPLDDRRAAPTLVRLRQLGCSSEGFPPRLLTVNVPPAVPLDTVMAYLASAGLKWENGDPETDRVPGRVAYRFRAAAQGEDQLGGLPPGVDAASWPRCKRCGESMPLVLLLRAHPQRLRFERAAGVALFCCAGDHAAACRAAEDGGSAVLLLDAEQLAAPHDRAAPISPLASSSLLYDRCLEPNPLADDRPPYEGARVDKIGGYPQWVHGNETPQCSRCRAPMALVAQIVGSTLDRLDPGIALGEGAGYLFVCPDEHEGRFVSQASGLGRQAPESASARVS